MSFEAWALLAVGVLLALHFTWKWAFSNALRQVWRVTELVLREQDPLDYDDLTNSQQRVLAVIERVVPKWIVRAHEDAERQLLEEEAEAARILQEEEHRAAGRTVLPQGTRRRSP
jgi:hypothetical protein